MSAWTQIFIFAMVAVVAIGVAYFWAEKHRQQLSAVASRLGLFFAPYPDDVHRRYARFQPFGRGSSQRCRNLLHGRRGGFEWELFDYSFQTGSGKNRQTHRFGIAAARVPLWFRTLQLRPEGFFDKVASFAGFDDINFESHEFSTRYHVSCGERKYAYDVIHPRMIEFLLQYPARHWQLSGDIILLHRRGRFAPYELEEVIGMVEGFVKHVPEYVKQEAPSPLPREFLE